MVLTNSFVTPDKAAEKVVCSTERIIVVDVPILLFS